MVKVIEAPILPKDYFFKVSKYSGGSLRVELRRKRYLCGIPFGSSVECSDSMPSWRLSPETIEYVMKDLWKAEVRYLEQKKADAIEAERSAAYVGNYPPRKIIGEVYE